MWTVRNNKSLQYSKEYIYIERERGNHKLLWSHNLLVQPLLGFYTLCKKTINIGKHIILSVNDLPFPLLHGHYSHNSFLNLTNAFKILIIDIIFFLVKVFIIAIQLYTCICLNLMGGPSFNIKLIILIKC